MRQCCHCGVELAAPSSSPIDAHSHTASPAADALPYLELTECRHCVCAHCAFALGRRLHDLYEWRRARAHDAWRIDRLAPEGERPRLPPDLLRPRTRAGRNALRRALAVCLPRCPAANGCTTSAPSPYTVRLVLPSPARALDGAGDGGDDDDHDDTGEHPDKDGDLGADDPRATTATRQHDDARTLVARLPVPAVRAWTVWHGIAGQRRAAKSAISMPAQADASSTMRAQTPSAATTTTAATGAAAHSHDSPSVVAAAAMVDDDDDDDDDDDEQDDTVFGTLRAKLALAKDAMHRAMERAARLDRQRRQGHGRARKRARSGEEKGCPREHANDDDDLDVQKFALAHQFVREHLPTLRHLVRHSARRDAERLRAILARLLASEDDAAAARVARAINQDKDDGKSAAVDQQTPPKSAARDCRRRARGDDADGCPLSPHCPLRLGRHAHRCALLARTAATGKVSDATVGVLFGKRHGSLSLHVLAAAARLQRYLPQLTSERVAALVRAHVVDAAMGADEDDADDGDKDYARRRRLPRLTQMLLDKGGPHLLVEMLHAAGAPVADLL